MASERQIFNLSGPLHLTSINWANANHRMSVAACLVQGVYIRERDRQDKRENTDQAQAPPWWEFFDFKLVGQLIDDADSSIFGAIFEYKPQPSDSDNSSFLWPRYVIAFRGTLPKGDSFSRDLQLDLQVVRNGLHRTSRYEIAMRAVRAMVASVGESKVWITGHSLGAAMAMLAGKSMAKNGSFLESFLFNPPFVSAPIERIKDKKVKQGIRIAGSVITAGLAVAVKATNSQNKVSDEDSFAKLSSWIPCLFVNPNDHICAEYVGYFEHRRKMEQIGAGKIERLATQHSIGALVMSAVRKDAGGGVTEPVHLIPSANLTVNYTPSGDFKNSHGLHQWWKQGQDWQCKTYRYQ